MRCVSSYADIHARARLHVRIIRLDPIELGVEMLSIAPKHPGQFAVSHFGQFMYHQSIFFFLSNGSNIFESHHLWYLEFVSLEVTNWT